MDKCRVCGQPVQGAPYLVMYHNSICFNCQREIAHLYAEAHLDPLELIPLRYDMHGAGALIQQLNVRHIGERAKQPAPADLDAKL